MISHEYRFIFVHVPKTGGNSIQTVLLPFSDDRKVVEGQQDGQDRFGIEGPITKRKHLTLAGYAKAVDLDRFKVVATCRHPVDRILSWYFSPHRWRRFEEGRWIGDDPVWDRDHFLAAIANVRRNVDFLMVDGKIRMPDVVLRFERLNASFASCAEQIGLPRGARTLPILNRTFAASDEIARARSDKTAHEAAASLFGEDFDTFGYERSSGFER